MSESLEIEMIRQVIGAGSRTVFGTRSNPRTIMILRNFDVPGIWGVNYGIAGSATQFGFVVEPDTGPGPLLTGLLGGMNAIADQFDAVIVSEQWLQDVSRQNNGLLYTNNVEIRWAKGEVSDNLGNGISASGGWGLIGGGINLDSNEDFKGVSFLVGPTYGAKLATISTSAFYLDFDDWSRNVKLYFINDRPLYDSQPDRYTYRSETGFGFSKDGEFFPTAEYNGPTLSSQRDILDFIEQNKERLGNSNTTLGQRSFDRPSSAIARISLGKGQQLEKSAEAAIIGETTVEKSREELSSVTAQEDQRQENLAGRYRAVELKPRRTANALSLTNRLALRTIEVDDPASPGFDLSVWVDGLIANYRAKLRAETPKPPFGLTHRNEGRLLLTSAARPGDDVERT